MWVTTDTKAARLKQMAAKEDVFRSATEAAAGYLRVDDKRGSYPSNTDISDAINELRRAARAMGGIEALAHRIEMEAEDAKERSEAMRTASSAARKERELQAEIQGLIKYDRPVTLDINLIPTPVWVPMTEAHMPAA